MKEIKGRTDVVEQDGIRMPKVLFEWGIDFNGWHENNALLTPVWWELKLIKEIGIEKYVQSHMHEPGKVLEFVGKKQWSETRGAGLPYLWEQFMQHEEPVNVLDVGCGQGELAVWYSTQGVIYTGIDIAMVNVGFCTALLPCLKFLKPDCPLPAFCHMSAESLRFEDKAFSMVFSCHSLEHVQDLDKAFAEQFRVGKKVCGVIARPREDESGEHLQQIDNNQLNGYLTKHCSDFKIEVFNQELIFWGTAHDL